ncbi:MAG TPA: hypothetical protein VE978_12325 [Chitinophagales bacterium]|nr:hypothetical protein [Chitinophagales bacterium]
MQLNKIKKHTLAAFASNGTINANDFMNNFKKHLEETLHVDKATIIGIVHSSPDSQNAMTVYFAYVTPEKKIDKESKNGNQENVKNEKKRSETGKKKKLKTEA